MTRKKVMKNMVLLFVLLMNVTVWAKEYHVSVNGKEAGDGSAGNPFRRIQAAADIAQPGDIITVHEGIYRERVNPPRGGTSDSNRIVYRAAPGEKVEIKGSEVITGWEKVQNDTWKVTIPNSFFGDFNPYNDVIKGAWYKPAKGFHRHTGVVYLNGTWLEETGTIDKVLKPVGSDALWYAQADESNTTIWAQFMGYDPSKDIVEINVRKLIFYPERPRCNYITVRGFIIRQAATPWCDGMFDMLAMIGTNWSKGWIIEDNVISHAICTGISMGQGEVIDPKTGQRVPGGKATDFLRVIEITVDNGWSKENIGGHVIRNNHISNCEQMGIYGLLGSIFSVIKDNTVCDIAVRQWLGGYDICGMMLCGGVEAHVKSNHWYRCGGNWAAIWLDWMCQGARVTGNLMHDNTRDMFLEVLHGPHLVDNNLFLSKRSLLESSGGGAFVHNIFAGYIRYRDEPMRLVPFFKPHTAEIVDNAKVVGDDERFINNLFVGFNGLSSVYRKGANLKVEDNVYLAGAKPDKSEKNAVVISGFNPGIELEERDDGWWLTMSVDPNWVSKQKRAIVTSEALGRAKVPDLPFEQPDGSPFEVDVDYFGRQRNTENPAPGPFEFSGNKSITIKVWPRESN